MICPQVLVIISFVRCVVTMPQDFTMECGHVKDARLSLREVYKVNLIYYSHFNCTSPRIFMVHILFTCELLPYLWYMTDTYTNVTTCCITKLLAPGLACGVLLSCF